MTDRFVKPMSSEESTSFKRTIAPLIDLAIAENGGVEAVRQAYTLMPGLLDFLAGWVARSFWTFAQGSQVEPRLTQEQIRRIYDIVRLRLDTESTTS